MVVHFKARSIGVFATQKKSDWINYKKSQENLYKNTTQTQKKWIYSHVQTRSMGWFLFLKLLEGTRPYSTQQVQYFFFPHLFLLSAFRAGYHLTHFASPPKVRIFGLGKKPLPEKLSLLLTPLQFQPPFLSFLFLLFFPRLPCALLPVEWKAKTLFVVSLFFAKLRTWTRNSILPLLTLALTTCFCPLAHFSPGHALRIRSAAPFLDWISACGFRMATGI